MRLCGYNVIRKDRYDYSPAPYGGGLFIAIKDSFKYNVILMTDLVADNSLIDSKNRKDSVLSETVVNNDNSFNFNFNNNNANLGTL